MVLWYNFNAPSNRGVIRYKEAIMRKQKLRPSWVLYLNFGFFKLKGDSTFGISKTEQKILYSCATTIFRKCERCTKGTNCKVGDAMEKTP